jgi:hypothetical protein
VPAYLWVSVVNLGAIPVLADIDDTFCLDPADVEFKITPRTTGVIAVHMSGRRRTSERSRRSRGTTTLKSQMIHAGGVSTASDPFRPLMDQVRLDEAALDFFGQPLSQWEKERISAAFSSQNSGSSIPAIEKVLDQKIRRSTSPTSISLTPLRYCSEHESLRRPFTMD